MNSFYNEEELKKIGLKSFGKNVLISKKCSIYGASDISIGNNVRIDDFCILSGDITLGNYVHIAAYSVLYGKGGIDIGDFCGVSARTTIYSAIDDFAGEFMISPLVPQELTNLKVGKVVLNNFVQLGANTTVMPNVTLEEGSVTGAFSLVLKNLEAWTINIGIPAQKYKARKKTAKELSERILNVGT